MSLHFTPFKTFADPTFFSKLGQHKLDKAKLEELNVPIHGFTTNPVSANKVPGVHFSDKSFDLSPLTGHSGNKYALQGTILNYNTIERFKELDKAKYIADAAAEIQDLIDSKEIFETPARLACFLAISYSDLKKYIFYHWFCFPSLPFQSTVNNIIYEPDHHLDRVIESHKNAAYDSGIFFMLNYHIDHWETRHLRSLNFHSKRVTVGIVEFGSTGGLPWHFRNFCSALRPFFEHALVYVYSQAPSGSYWVDVDLRKSSTNEAQVLGWERNSKGKLAPKVSDMGSLQDPLQLADQAVDLNLKLMKWRAAPEIDLDGLRNSKCLLLGAGTLGCYVSRGLLAWGVRHISLVDSGKVSYSNPVRQPLFTLEDSKNGVPKAEAAAKALRDIFPGVEARGYQLEIPMAGHPITNETEQHNDYEKLCKLIDEHDAIFLLMDSRESRWLPTVLSQAKQKLVVNVAIGFDSYLVMRHGVTGQNDQRLGCYFCNDVVAPIDSVSRLSLDQMCTVTRPGVAMMAASQAVELLANIYQSPKKEQASHDEETILGKVSHQLRGFMRSHDIMNIWGPAFPSCSACSEGIVDAWNEDGWNFVKCALNDNNYLTDLSGLGHLQRATEDLDLSEDDGDLE